MYSKILQAANGTYNGSIVELAVEVIEQLADLNARITRLEVNPECSCCPSDEEIGPEPVAINEIPDEQRDPTEVEKYGPGIKYAAEE